MTDPQESVLPGGRATASLMRSVEWLQTPLGPLDAWPQPLRTLFDVMLGSPQPMFVAWGPERTMLYNDAYARLCGAKHPWAFGRPFAEVWADILEDVGSIMDRAYAGESIHMDDLVLFMTDRRDRPEETHFSFSYTPVRGQLGQVAGVFCVCTETTAQVFTQRENVRLLARIQGTARMLQQWFEQAPGFIALLRGPNHVFELVNQAYYQLVGHRDILGKPAFEALPDVRAQGFEELLNRVFQTGEPFVGHALRLLVQREPGAPLTEAFVDLVYQPVFEPDGAVSGIFSQGHDVTEQVRATETLRDSEARLRLALQSPSFGSFDWDVVAGQMSFSPSAQRIYGFEQAVLPANAAFEHVHPDDRAQAESAAAAAMDGASGGEFVVQHRFLHPSGRVGSVDVRGQVQFDTAPDGSRRPVRVAGIVLDLTEREQTLAALRTSEARYRWLAENLAAGAFSWDLKSGAVSFPRRTREVFGFAEDEPIDAERVFARVHPDDLAAVRAAIAPALDPAVRADYRATNRVVRPDGSVRWVDTAGQAQFEAQPDGTQHAVHVAGVIWDVTDYQRLVAALQEADARKDEFLAMLAHELRNPLAPLTNAHRLIERTESLTDTGRAALSMAQRQTRHMHRLVDDLLEVSRVSRGKIKLKCEPMMVATAVYQAAESVAATIATRGQTLRVAVPEEPAQIVADPTRIAQVLENLLTNASKYTPEGGAIRVAVENRPREVEVRVTDNGIGIEPMRIADVFELFSQIDATIERSQGGLGIGLALVKRLVELHGGSVAASSPGKGQGATFTVRLPRMNTASSEPIQ